MRSALRHPMAWWAILALGMLPLAWLEAERWLEIALCSERTLRPSAR